MKYKMIKNELMYRRFNRRFDLQKFAEDGDDSQGTGKGEDGQETGDDGDDSGEDGGDKGDNKPKTFSQEELDKIVEKRIAKERAKLKAEAEKQVKDAQAEAEKLAKMNAEQKRQYEQEKLQKQMEDIKAENAKLKAEAFRSELGREAASILKESDIDATQDILDFVVGEDAETTKNNITKFVGIIQAQIKAHDIKRATGSTPRNYGGSKDKTDPYDAIVNKYKR